MFNIGDRVRILGFNSTGVIINIRSNWYYTIRLDIPNEAGINPYLWIATGGEIKSI